MRVFILSTFSVFGLVACGGHSSGGAVPPEDLGSELERVLCESFVECHLFPDVETCMATTFLNNNGAELTAAIDRGTVTYDGDKARECLDALRSVLTCSRAESA